MKRIFAIFLVLIACKCNTTQIMDSTVNNPSIQQSHSLPDSMLYGIQSKIYNAFVQCMISGNNQSLSDMASELENLSEDHHQNLTIYWQSYLQFYSSIFYLKRGDTKTAEREVDKGIDWLKEMKNKNSEDYALLAHLQGFSMQFKGMNAKAISDSMKMNIKEAIALDSTNLRAYYVYANNDFYTPKMYGGGQKTEEYLLKTTGLPAQQMPHACLPSWGKEESYELLIKLYIREEKWNKAKQYYEQGLNEFPDSYIIKQLASGLVGI
ncbi:MAG TPA: hypothetical protein PKL52_03220 [Tenuifilaceae bacterium]|nr:hypothetical protein [Tenuifilaceae bacterium]